MSEDRAMKAILERHKPRRPLTKADFEWINQRLAWDALTQAFGLQSAVASMLLDGLVATGNVRALDKDGNLIDLDECTIGELQGKAAYVAADELRDWLSKHSTVSQGPQARDRSIAQKLREGINPPHKKSWKEFYDLIRDECGGWIVTGGKRCPARSFSDKQIQRAVKALRAD
jgi:hypothetical protein